MNACISDENRGIGKELMCMMISKEAVIFHTSIFNFCTLLFVE